MVALKSFLTTSVVLIAAFMNVEAAVSPTYPSPGAIETEGKPFDITWTFDGKNPSVTYKIDFMTGSNDQQTVLANVATGVDPKLLKYSFTPPKVEPEAAVYFFQFTGSDGVASWATRFGIVAPGGKLAAEPNPTQPNGDKIPWGVGKIVGASVATGNNSSVSAAVSSAAVSSAPVVASSAAPSASSSAPAVSAPAVTSAVPTVAQVKPPSSGAIVKPALTLVSAVVAGYFAL